MHAVQAAQLLYRPIAEYGAIGEGRSAALIGPDGSVDWWCPGRFDAPSVFARILDGEKGGHFRLGPTLALKSVMRYLPETNVLETRHETSSGVVRVVDHVPFPEDTGLESAVLVRRATCDEGSVEMSIEFAPRFHYGAVQPRFAPGPQSLFARGAGQIMILRGADLTTRGGVASGRVLKHAGQTLEIVLRHRPFDVPVPFANALALSPSELEEATVARWRAWSAGTRAEGPDAHIVRRAALALKLLQYAPSGAIVAAPTTSLPETPGGVRNWDYRYAWVRDAVLSARALQDAGHADDAAAVARWLDRAVSPGPDAFRIMYTVTHSGDLEERELAHLEGYEASRPVRIGNGAATQRQLDVYGELFEFATHAPRAAWTSETWRPYRELADWVADHWREPDSGIWEMRSRPRHFVLSKAMAWAALTRAAQVARTHGLEGDTRRWIDEADAARADALDHGYDARIGSFTQAYGETVLDASNLLLPLIGFVDARDPRMIGTVERILERLTVDGLVYRYLGADDGVSGDDECAFAYCSFWLVEVLARQGRVAEARALFDRMKERATSLGLYAEEIDPRSGRHYGNFPQGFPHAGLIQAARALWAAERADAA